jgi:hypothetical protein
VFLEMRADFDLMVAYRVIGKEEAHGVELSIQNVSNAKLIRPKDFES